MKKIIVAIAAVLALSGCSISIDSKPSESATPTETLSQSDVDTAFLDVVRDEIPAFADAPDSTIITAGNELCTILEDASPLDVSEVIGIATGFADGTGVLTDDEGLFFTGASAGAYCPDIAEEIMDLTGNSTI